MPLSAGERLGPYEIAGFIGAGGMGEVYRAHDSRLGRHVAIKVSSQRFSERFEREARLIASLNHPNICQLYDVGPNYLVMELVEGESPQGPLALHEALHIARQICEALEAAHEKGVVHRDLKPGNIKITPAGTVKVLDFGLAKQSPAADGGGEDSPTLSMAATQAGMILGTAGYMSPEQARGKRVDKRADIWAFGVVLYELLTGSRLFKGEDVSETMAAVIKEEPNLDRVPASVRPLLQRCLEKDPKKRLRDIADAMPLVDLSVPSAPTPAGQNRGSRLWPSIAIAAVVLAGVALWTDRRATPAEPEVLRFQIYPPEKTSFAGFVDQPPAISPDGKRLAFYAMGEDGRTRIWIRDLDSLDARRLDGTEEAGNMFWSPDNRWIAFRSGAELKKIPASGGPAQSLCACLVILPGAWSKAGVIVFGTTSGMMKVSENGGAVTQLTSLDPKRGEVLHFLPSFLPDGRHFLYTRISRMQDKQGLYTGSTDAKPEQQPLNRLLDRPAFYAADPGRLIFWQGAALLTQSFDPDRVSLTGEATQILEGLTSSVTVSANALAFGGVGAPVQLTWFNRQGKPLETIGEPGPLGSPHISPDNMTIAFNRSDTGPADVWLYEARRGAYQFTFGGDRENPVWSPDSSHLAFALAGAGWSLLQKAASGVGNEESLYTRSEVMIPFDWSRDGKFLLFTLLDTRTKIDTWVLPLTGDKKAFPYLNSDANEDSPRLSPDGKWLAYHSDKVNGRYEVYVDTFTGQAAGGSSPARGSWPVSTSGGTRPVWSRDGKELFFIGVDRRMMVAEVTNSSGSRFEFSTPQPLFDARISGSIFDLFDVSKDGRFLMPVQVEKSTGTPITVVVNWTAALKK